MTRKIALQAAMELPAGERLELVHELWDSLVGQLDDLPLTEEQRRGLDLRLEEYESDPTGVVPWEQVRMELLREKP